MRTRVKMTSILISDQMADTSDYEYDASSCDEKTSEYGDSDNSIQFWDELNEQDYRLVKAMDSLPDSTEEIMLPFKEEMKCNVCDQQPSTSQAFIMLQPWIEKSMQVYNLAVENVVQAAPSDAYVYCSTCDRLFHYICCFENIWEGFPQPPQDISIGWKCCKCLK